MRHHGPMSDPTSRDRAGAGPWWAVLLLLGYLVAMAVVVGWPDGWAVNRLIVRIYYDLGAMGMPWGPMGPDDLAMLLNVLICIPPVIAAMHVLPRSPWWLWVVLGFLLSCAVELTQFYSGIGRDGSVVDIALNTTGALIGGLIGRWTRDGRRRT